MKDTCCLLEVNVVQDWDVQSLAIFVSPRFSRKRFAENNEDNNDEVS